MTEYRVLHRGWDSLDVAVQGALPGVALAALREAKARAVQAAESVYVELEGVPCHVAETGARGGYAFRIDTGPAGELWTIKDNPDPQQWNIRVSVRAAQLAVDGYAEVKAALYARLKQWGAVVLSESVARVDFAVDFEAPEFLLRPDDFVCHSRATVAEHGRMIPRAGDEADMAVSYKGRRPSSVTVGKMPGRQVIVYDKRREVLTTGGKSFWFDVWGTTRDECPPVWRVEVRAGKNHLKDWRITTFADLEERGGDMMNATMQAVRLIRPGGTDSNVTRAALHPLWQQAAAIVADAMADHVCGAERGRIVEGRREELRTMYGQQVIGLATGYAVTAGLSLAEAVDRLAAEVADEITAYVDGRSRDFRRKFDRATRRLFFIGEAGAAAPA